MPSRVSLSDLRAAQVSLRPVESVAIVRELCRQIVAGTLRGVPSMHVVRLCRDGRVTAEGPVEAHSATVSRAARLLEELLPSAAEAKGDGRDRASGALRLVILRARNRIDLPPYAGFEEFAQSLARFAPADSAQATRDVYARWAAAVNPGHGDTRLAPATVLTASPRGSAPLTISDVRRARRATGLTLAEVAERARVPAMFLRELEWGYLWNWPGGRYGRAQLVRYARAAGLDERLVLQVAWPLLEAAVDARGGEVVDAIPAEESIEILIPDSAEASQALLPADAPLLHVVPPFVAAAPTRSHRHRLVAVAAAAVLVGAIPAAIWYQHSVTDAAPLQATAVTAQVEAPAMPVVAKSAESVREEPAQTTPPAARARPVRAVEIPDAYSPSFAHAGSAMFFHEETGGSSALVRADTDRRGTVLKITRIVDDNSQNFHARPSPDGTRIAFDSDREGVRAVYVADEDGRHVRRVSGDGFAAVPSWSPDGTHLAFVKAEPANSRVWNLWIADLQSGEMKRLTSYKYGQPWGASWFPDGRRVAYSHEDQLVVLDLETGRRRTFHSPLPGRLLRTPAVSPDGGRIVFQVYRDGTWLLDLTHGQMRKVLDDPTAEEYTWAPDGHRVAFHSRRAGGWGVWVMGQ